MSYLQRLSEFSEKCPVELPAKPAKPPFEGFAGDPTCPILEIRAEPAPISDDQVRLDLQRWRRGLARLDAGSPKAGTDAGRWEELTRDALELFNSWADQARRLGWHGADLFGVDPAALDDDAAHGLVWRLRGRTMRTMTEAGAVYDLRSGGLGRFYRGDHSKRVPLWSIS